MLPLNQWIAVSASNLIGPEPKSTGVIAALDNSGIIKGYVSAIKSEGAIGTLTNSGTIESGLSA